MASKLTNLSDEDVARELVARLDADQEERRAAGDLAPQTARVRQQVAAYYGIEPRGAP